MITASMIDEDLIQRIWDATASNGDSKQMIAETLAWLAEHPIPPTWKDMERMAEVELTAEDRRTTVRAATAWQRVAYLRKEEPIPQEVKDLLYAQSPASSMTNSPDGLYSANANLRILQAYRLGRKESK